MLMNGVKGKVSVGVVAMLGLAALTCSVVASPIYTSITNSGAFRVNSVEDGFTNVTAGVFSDSRDIGGANGALYADINSAFITVNGDTWSEPDTGQADTTIQSGIEFTVPAGPGLSYSLSGRYDLLSVGGGQNGMFISLVDLDGGTNVFSSVTSGFGAFNLSDVFSDTGTLVGGASYRWAVQASTLTSKAPRSGTLQTASVEFESNIAFFAIPEPASLSLLSMAGLAIWRVVRKRAIISR